MLRNIERLDGMPLQRITPTGAMQPDQWLLIDVVELGLTLYVSDANAYEVHRRWPHVPMYEINNTGTEDLTYTTCVN